jgi:hypothetical protein
LREEITATAIVAEQRVLFVCALGWPFSTGSAVRRSTRFNRD